MWQNCERRPSPKSTKLFLALIYYVRSYDINGILDIAAKFFVSLCAVTICLDVEKFHVTKLSMMNFFSCFPGLKNISFLKY